MIDALFGAGLARDIDGEAKAIIERINAFKRAGVLLLAVDVPSGIDGETGGSRRRGRGERERDLLSAEARPSPGCRDGRWPGRSGSPTSAFPILRLPHRAASLGQCAGRLGRSAAAPQCRQPQICPRRGLILSGSGHHTGAARLAARAAFLARAGIVSVASPPDAVAVNAAQLTAVMVAPFANAREFEALIADERRRAIALGPGAGVGPPYASASRRPFPGPPSGGRRARRRCADELRRRSRAARGADQTRRTQAVMTPHEGEFTKLFEGAPGSGSTTTSSPAPARRRASWAPWSSSRAPTPWSPRPTAARPSAGTCRPGSRLPARASAVGPRHRPRRPGHAPFEAASAAVWLHGACGRAVGPGLIAEDLPEALPGVLRALG